MKPTEDKISLRDLLTHLEKLEKEASPPSEWKWKDIDIMFGDDGKQNVDNAELAVEARKALPTLISALKEAMEMAEYYSVAHGKHDGATAREWLERWK